jgi:hypothetical protein
VLVDLHPLNETLVWAARPVRTASANQVRRPLYANAVGRWQPYEPWLAPLLAELRGSAVLHEG